MSYSSRVYRQRNAHTHEETRQQPFFSKQHDMSSSKKNAFFQAKLAIGKPGDAYEQEADAVAHSVVSGAANAVPVQQKKISSIRQMSMDPEKEKLKKIQKKEEPLKEEEEMKNSTPVQTMQEGNTTAPAQVTSGIEHSSGKGKALPPNVLHEMNASFGVDFSHVQVHHDNVAADMNKELQAQAFTHGRDIYFNEGRYNPESAGGKFLLAHELAHVVQQGGAYKNGTVKEDTIQKSPLLAAGIGAALAAAFLCAYKFFQYALDNFPDKSDKWKHCWVSCKITSWCGGSAISLLVGAGKEGIDAICDAYGGGCKAEFLDFLADLEGIACSYVPLLPCTDCCDNTAAYL